MCVLLFGVFPGPKCSVIMEEVKSEIQTTSLIPGQLMCSSTGLCIQPTAKDDYDSYEVASDILNVGWPVKT